MNITIKEALRRASSFLKQHHIEEADLEAEVLIRYLYHWDRSRLFLNWHQPMLEDKQDQLKIWLERRILHEPLQYIIGCQEFFGRKFHVNSNVLIPRPETELLIETVMEEAARMWGDTPVTVADIGTGSGAIAVTLALEKINWFIHSIDISEKALITAADNANKLQAKVTFHHGNLLLPLIEKKLKIDMIVSNPPYIPREDIKGLMKEVKDYEPILALDGGDDGLQFYRQIIHQSRQVLKRPGLIAFEIGIDQSEPVKELLYQSGAAQVNIRSDFQGISRIITASYRSSV